MTQDTGGPLGPNPAAFEGDGAAQAGKRMFHATRPKFFPASALPVLAGTAWGYSVSGLFDPVVFVLALVSTVLVHAAANVLNDVGDEIGGSDRRNAHRIYPYTGGSQFIQSGIMSVREMKRWGFTLLAVGISAGLVLVALRGPLVLAFGLTGVVLGVLYSLGPRPLSGLGVGEAGVAVAFGLLPVTGAAWLQSGVVDVPVVVFSLPVSMWVAAILLINEVPDRDADGAVGKRTLPVRLGLGSTRVIYLALHAIAAAAVAGLVASGHLTPWALSVALLLVLAMRAAAGIAAAETGDKRLRQGIEATLGIHTLGGIGLTIFAILSASL